MIAGAALLLGLPLITAVVVYVLRRWAAAGALLSTVVAGGLAWVCWQWPPQATVILPWGTLEMGWSVPFLGQELRLSSAAQPLLVFTCTLMAVCFVYGWCTSQGRSFFYVSLVLLSLFNASVVTQPLTWAVLWLAVAAAVAVFAIQAGRPGTTQGAVRWLVFPIMAVPLFLVAGWYLEQASLNPDDIAAFASAAGWLAPALVLLLAVVPVHGAIPALTAQAPPLASAFLILGTNGVALFLLNAFLRAYPWLAGYYDVSSWLLWLGLATAGWSGALAAGQNRFGMLWGYAALYDFGCLLVALGLGGPLGLTLAVSMFIARAAAVVVGAMGLANLLHRAQGDSFSLASGAASRLPWSVAGLIAGGLGLAGLPLTVGFPGRWALLQFLGHEAPRVAVILLLGASGVTVGYLRGLRAVLGPLHRRSIEREPAIGSAVIALLLVACTVLSLRPQALDELVTTVTQALATIARIPL